jgi:hypothetical protein
VAITASLLTEGGSTVDGSSYVTASVTPTANRLVLLFLGIGDAAAGGADEAPSSVTGNGLTWVQIAFDQRSTSSQAHAVFRALGASPTAGAITVNFTNPQDALTWHVIEVAGIDTSGTNGSGAVAEVVTSEGTSSGSIALTGVTAGNASIGGVQMNSSTAGNFTGFGTWTQVGTTQAVATPSLGSAVGFDSTGGATMTVNFAGAQSWSGAVVELVLAPVASAWPTHSVCASWTTQPRATPVWVDISAYVVSVSWRSPTRRTDKDRFDAGTLTVVLKNEDRRFDPTYTSGAYAPNVKLMRRLKWEVTVGATTYTKFEGYIDRIPQEYSPPQVARATIHATDGLGVVLSKMKLPMSPWDWQITTESPAHWWKANEGTGSATLADAGGTPAPATITGTAPSFGAASLIYGDPSSAVQWVSGGVGVIQPSPPDIILPATYGFTIEGWFQTTTVGSPDKILFLVRGSGAQQIKIWIGGTAVGGTRIGRLVMEASDFISGAIVSRAIESTILVDDSATHHFVASFSNATTFALWIDGVDRSGTLTTFGGGAPPAWQWRSAYIGNAAPGAADATFGGVLDEIMVWNFALLSPTPATHYAFGTAPWKSQTTGTRLGTLLDVVGWPAANRTIDTGSSTVQAAVTAGQSLLDHAQLLEKSESGLLFVEGGNVRFISRSNRYKAPYDTVQQTFGDDPAELGYTELAYDYNYTSIINEARLTREGGAEQVASDDASDLDYYTSTYEDSGFLNETDAEILDKARWHVGRSKDPIQEVQSLTVEPTDSNGLFPYVVPLKVFDRVRAKRRPQGVGSAIDQEVHIYGIEVEATDRRWVQTMTVSPADTRKYWRVGTTGYSEVGASMRVGW